MAGEHGGSSERTRTTSAEAENLRLASTSRWRAACRRCSSWSPASAREDHRAWKRHMMSGGGGGDLYGPTGCGGLGERPAAATSPLRPRHFPTAGAGCGRMAQPSRRRAQPTAWRRACAMNAKEVMETGSFCPTPVFSFLGASFEVSTSFLEEETISSFYTLSPQ